VIHELVDIGGFLRSYKMYKKIYDPFTQTDSVKYIFKTFPIPIWISVSEENADYREYLKWVEAGNTIESADTPE
jgi:hypothetical protein